MRILALSTILAVLATSGCGTTTGILCGTTGGGTSLTSTVWQSDANPVVKTILTPATIVGGTVGGLGVGICLGVDYDITFSGYCAPFKTLVRRQSDPFGAGLFDPAPPEQYFVILDERILGTVKPDRRGDMTQASGLALALEAVKSAGAASLKWQGGTIRIVSEKSALEAKANEAREFEEKKKQRAREMEALNATTAAFTVVATDNSYSAATTDTLRIPVGLMADESAEAMELFIRNELRPRAGIVVRTDKTNKVITLTRKPSVEKETPAK